MPTDKEFSAWLRSAKNRDLITLMDGREAKLMAVRRHTRSCKIVLEGRHTHVWVEDIALVKVTSEERPEGVWTLLPPWKVVPLPEHIEVRSSRAETSKSWTKVVHNPKAIHPAFHSSAS